MAVTATSPSSILADLHGSDHDTATSSDRERVHHCGIEHIPH